MAAYNIGVLHYEAGETDEAARCWTRAAELGVAEAMFNLGNLARKAGDMERARDWWRKAALNGQSIATVSLGLLSFYERDWEEARRWWTLGAEQRNVTAMLRLGLFEHLVSNWSEATYWLTEAVDNGDDSTRASAAYALGDSLIALGRYEEAISWFRAAVELNLPDAQDRLDNVLSLVRVLQPKTKPGDAPVRRRWGFRSRKGT